jgi:hypothetical protein
MIAGDLRPLGLPIRLSLYSNPGIKTDRENAKPYLIEPALSPRSDYELPGFRPDPIGVRDMEIAPARPGRERTHKIEIYDTAEKTLPEMQALIETVFEFPADKTEITRLDCCADVEGTSVDWFVQHTVVQFKRVERAIMLMKLRSMKYETWYAGKKPNQVRIYDKTGERRHQLNYENRRREKDGEKPLEFHERFGYPEELTITRVERQDGGRALTTFAALSKLASFEAFNNLRIAPNGAPDRSLHMGGDFSFILQGEALRARIARNGLQSTQAWVRHHAGRNYARFWKRFEDWLSLEDEEPAVTVKELNARFQSGIATQLRAA